MEGIITMSEAVETLDTNVIASKKLRDFVKRIESLEDEKAAYAEDIKVVYREVKTAGLDTKTIKQIIKFRKMDEADLIAQEELLNLYRTALGM